MLQTFCKRKHMIYMSLPVLGPILEGFAEYLAQLGYSQVAIQRRLHITPQIDRQLQKHKCYFINDLQRDILRRCKPNSRGSQTKIEILATIKLLEKYLEICGTLAPEPISQIEKKIINYQTYLHHTCGFSTPTVRAHCLIASRFISKFNSAGYFDSLSKLTSTHIEDFLLDSAKKVGRDRLRHIAAYLRSYLRFLVICGEAPVGIDKLVDAPHVYREEKLPRTLEWETVHTLLSSIDRTTALGKRDYAMLLLIATYGLRAGEVVSLKLEDIEWKSSQIRICQHKTSTILLLPLINSVGESILEYLRYGRPKVSFREIFVRHRTPGGVLKATAVSEVFQACSRRSGLEISFQGPHCIRHSFAVHLLRQGVSLKAIGDILGHKDIQSTYTYLRLNLEDLRSVPLCIPTL